ncbi:ARM repeat-containing protein [Gigaspora margarita]|uniref:Deoxyhypusine hydroxylase n=1 Tax=Gigaspora margarita TaxID=4874 RepID=A0A8H3XEE1_GIGMA|nr:ARM repeat-containing protein [Gigaspora margarita]
MTSQITSQESLKLDPAAYDNLETTLTNKNGQIPLHKRFRAMFTLKNLADKESIDILAKAFDDDSILLKHEVAYVLGQIKNPYANPVLRSILANQSEDPMVRHEAAEALGAIGDLSSLDILEEYLHDENVVVRETCELAIAKIKYENGKNGQEISKSIYTSIDPAPPNGKVQSVTKLRDILLDTNLPLFERYRAMFALRNLGTTEAVLALAQGLDDPSDLFRHEIAYVFGQIQSPASVPALIKTLENMNELYMVRHEAAEALGSIATSDCLPVLRKFKNDQERVVKESCEVALDMFEYENSQEFQYADGLINQSIAVDK